MERDQSNITLARQKYQKAIAIDEKIHLIPLGEQDHLVLQYYQQKLQLFLESAKYYFQAMNDIPDENVKFALIYLANQSADEAAKVKNLIIYSQQGEKTNLQRPTSSMKPSSLSVEEKIQDKEFVIYSQRILLQAHLNRMEENERNQQQQHQQQQITAVLPTPKEMVKDLLGLEEKIQQLGIKRINSDQFLRESALQKSTHLTSKLGESFMVLGNNENKNSTNSQQRNHQSYGITRNNKIYSFNNGDPAGETLSNKQLVEQTNRSLQQRGGKRMDMNISTIALPTIEQMPNYSTQVKGLEMPSASKLKSEPSNDNTASKTNQTSSSSSSNKVASDIVNMILKAENEADTEIKLESIERLLQTIATLRDENSRLEEENQRVRSDMNYFKEDYKQKFETLQPLLEKIKDAENTNSAKKKSDSISALPPNPPPPSSSTSKSADSPDIAKMQSYIATLQSRQEHLQSIVEGLLQQHYKAKDIITRLREKIAVYEKGSMPPSSTEKTVEHEKVSKTSTTEISMAKGNERIENPSPEKKKEPSSLNFSPNVSFAATSNPGLNPSAASRRQTVAAVALQNANAARIRHPSTSTLQCLQPHFGPTNVSSIKTTK